MELHAIDAGRTLRGIGALAATIFARSTGELAAGAKASAWNAEEMLAVDCGSAPVTASRARMAAICAGVACFGGVDASPQKPRALMMSAGVCGFESAGSAEACFDFAGCTTGASAEASWKVAAAEGLARGIGTVSADLTGTGAAVTPAGLLSATTSALAPSSSSSLDLRLNKAAHRLGLDFVS